jgi:subtilisin family serine protease
LQAPGGAAKTGAPARPPFRFHRFDSLRQALPAILAILLLAAAFVEGKGHLAYADMGDDACLDVQVRPYGLDRIRAREAHAITTGSPEVVVAVVDSGVDAAHPDLAGHLWVNAREIPGNGLDDDRNGYVDDVTGYNFVSPRGNNPDDTLGHGTFIARVVASVAPEARIMPVRAGNDRRLRRADALAAIRYAVDNGAWVINMSFGSSEFDPAVRDVLDYALTRDVVIVMSAGNDGDTTAGAAFYPQALRVAATTPEDRLASFSNRGPWVDVAAPGTLIHGALPNYRHGVCEGTSFSAPFAAGVAALVRSADPTLTAPQVIDRIRTTATDLNGANPQLGGTLTFGRLDAYRALGGATSSGGR